MTTDELLYATKTLSADNAEDAILGIFEAVTKLWVAHKRGGDTSEKLANLFIGVAIAANSMSATNIESDLKRRLSELA